MNEIDTIFNSYPYLHRLITIAMVGNFDISVYSDIDNVNAKADYLYIKKVLCEEFDKFNANGIVKFELTPIETCKIKKMFSMQSINDLVNEGLSNVSTEICDTGKILIDTGIKGNSLSLEDVKNVKNIAHTIARIEESIKIEPIHVAEAMHIVIKPTKGFILLEEESVNFGNSINISKFANIEEINQAVDYLNKLKHEMSK